MSSRVIAEDFLNLGMLFIRRKDLKKFLDFFQGESQILSYLNKKTGQKVFPKDISDELEISQARVALLLNKLEKSGYIHRQADERDSRRTRVSLTELGTNEIDNRTEEMLDLFLKFIETVGESDSEELLKITKKFTNSL